MYVVKLVVSVVLVLVTGIVTMLVITVVFVSVTGTVFVVDPVVITVDVTAQFILVDRLFQAYSRLTWTRCSSNENSARGVAGGRSTRLCIDCLGLDFRSGSLPNS